MANQRELEALVVALRARVDELTAVRSAKVEVEAAYREGHAAGWECCTENEFDGALAADRDWLSSRAYVALATSPPPATTTSEGGE